MAGADRAIRELMFIFKDDPIEIPLEEATMSVWARMCSWKNRSIKISSYAEHYKCDSN